MFRRSMLIVLSVLLMLAVSACGQRASTGAVPDATAQVGAASGDGMGVDTTSTAMPMAHGGMTMDGTSTAVAMDGMTTAAPFDAQFIDGMIVHHTGAIDMAEQALTESERPEIKELAQNIISSQQQEVEQMTNWRTEWYPDLAPTAGMAMDMGDMEVSADESQPFDQRFIAAMIGHHNGAIAMAQEAQTKAEHLEIKELAGEIIKAQEAEVSQMQQWSTEWFDN